MTRRKRIIFGTLLLGTLVLVLAIATLNYLLHMDEGPTHTFALAGSAALTDEQAIEFGRQTLIADGRLHSGMDLEPVNDATFVGRGDDKSFCAVSWWYPMTPKRYFVNLHRMPGQVEAFSNPGK